MTQKKKFFCFYMHAVSEDGNSKDADATDDVCFATISYRSDFYKN